MVKNEQIFPGPKMDVEKLSAVIKQFCQGMKVVSVVHKSSKDMEESIKEKLLGEQDHYFRASITSNL